MSLYNQLFGENPMAKFILGTLGLRRRDFGRYRDCFVQKVSWKENFGHLIAVFTRNGGGNRRHWEDSGYEGGEGPECLCPGCIITYRMPLHPLYANDHDDQQDSTYATIYFRLPEKHEKELVSMATEYCTASSKIIGLVDAMQRGDDTQLTRNAVEVGRKIFEKLEKASKGGPKIIDV